MNPSFCITGITGQDGSYAAEILLLAKIKVIGLTRNKSNDYVNISNFYSDQNFKLVETDYSEKSLKRIIEEYEITNILNFAGQSYVCRSWETIEETLISQSMIVSRFLNLIEKNFQYVKFINAGSSEIFAESNERRNELSRRSPCNPYGCSQLYASSLIEAFRNSKQLWLCTAILFPHESIRRNNNFLFMQILNQIDQILQGKSNQISIGNPYVIRDWGLAPEYCFYTILMMMMDSPEDLCLATGIGRTVIQFVSLICDEYDINFSKVMNIKPELFRNYEPISVVGDNNKLISKLNIPLPTTISGMVKKTIDAKKEIIKKELRIDNISNYLSYDKIQYLKKNKNKFVSNRMGPLKNT